MDPDLIIAWPGGLLANAVVFVFAGAVIAVGGVLLTARADMIADRTGLGEAITGGVLLGASTSISGSITSITAAATAHPNLAVSNAVGGIAVQTAFLAVADVTYRRANLEHAAPSSSNLIQASFLILMLTVPLIAALLPALEVWRVHVVTPVILATYIFALRTTARARRSPMWRPTETSETRRDEVENRSLQGLGDFRLYIQFAGLMTFLGVAGWLIANSGIVIARETGIEESLVGTLLTATTTSLPELITTLAAVRRGALQLAVGGIIGGNTFDVLFLVMSDAAYSDGSIYHAVDRSFAFWSLVGIAMTTILLLGLIRRERHGPANIGFESILIFIIYGLSVTLSVWIGV